MGASMNHHFNQPDKMPRVEIQGWTQNLSGVDIIRPLPFQPDHVEVYRYLTTGDFYHIHAPLNPKLSQGGVYTKKDAGVWSSGFCDYFTAVPTGLQISSLFLGANNMEFIVVAYKMGH